ncbi:Flp pilus assembly complex ATPase component TadA [Candidatus Peregrinibacteria bacterium]|nr:MAG: Flp pilus assembly complex ATPase component TadA [Candidatus Peregrinibacteria bacterium]
MMIPENKLIEALRLKGISEDLIQSTLDEARQSRSPFFETLQKRHIVADEILGKMVADILGYPYINLSKIQIPNEVLEIVPENIALKQGVITFEVNEEKNIIKIATVNPLDLEMISDLEKKTGREAEVYYTTTSNIKNIIGKYNQELKHIFLNMLPEHIRFLKPDEKVSEAIINNISEEIPIVKIFDTILLHAYRHHASDIHIEATKQYTVIRYRIDGVLHKIVNLPKIIHEPLVTRCKILSSLRIDETRAAQDGRINLKLDNDSVSFRVSILPTHFGEKS